MSRGNAREYTNKDKSIIRGLYPKYDEKYIANLLNRTPKAIATQRRKMKIFTPKEKFLTDAQTLEVESEILANVSITKLVERYNVHRTVITNTRDILFDRLSKNKPKYIETSGGFRCLGSSGSYWDKEDQIAESLNLQYNIEDLTGWEKEQLQNKTEEGTIKTLYNAR